MRTLLYDCRYAWRGLRRAPGFAAVTIVTLALGIGANTAVFSVLKSVVLAPLPYDEPEQLVRLYHGRTIEPDQRQFLSGPDILDIREGVEAFESVGIHYTYREIGRDLTTDGQPTRLRVLRIGAGYFGTYRATPQLGRVFRREEERADTRRVVLSHQLWSTALGQNPNIVGSTVELDGEAYEVIGVMRSTFRDMTTADIAAWIPEDLERARGNNRGNYYLSAVARLATGVSVAQAQAEVDTVMAGLTQRFPESNADQLMQVVPLHGDVVGGSARAVSVLMGAAGLVLLIACVNVASLFLVRAVARGRNTAIRMALGAGRRRVVVQHLTESLVVAAAGGLLGSVVAHWGVQMLLRVSPESLARAETVGFDVPLLLFAVVLTTLAGAIFGLGPAWRAARVDPGDALHDGARGNTDGRGTRHVHALLVMTQVAVALMLLAGAGVLVHSLLALQAVDLGFQAQQVATFEVHLPPIRYGEPAQRVRFHRTYLDRLRAAPGIIAAGATSWLPANGAYHRWGYGYLDGSAERQWTGAMVRTIEGEYFDALGIPLLRGRQFTSDDQPDTEPVAVISQSLAAQVYGDGEPIGERFRTGGREFAVVGIVGDVAFEADGDEFGTVYVSHGQFGDDRHWALTYAVKTSASPASALTTARQVLQTVDDALVLHQPRAMTELVSSHQAQTRFTVLLLVLFAVIAVTLAGVGVYGVLAYAVSQRTHEIGVRMALGAQPGHVRSIVVWQGAWLAGIGLVAGLAGALALSRFLSVLTFGVSARDPLVFIAVTALLAAVVLGASYLPARRATRIDPLVALRAE